MKKINKEEGKKEKEKQREEKGRRDGRREGRRERNLAFKLDTARVGTYKMMHSIHTCAFAAVGV